MLRRLIFLIIISIVLQASSILASSNIQSTRAIEIQAAFLIKFCSYVKWPKGSFSSPGEPVIIGIFGQDPFGSRIDTIARSFEANGRKVEVRRFRDISSLDKVHILFISSSEAPEIDTITRAISNRSVLLVSNIPNFLEHSGMINFIVVGNNIRFDISKANSQKAGLMISSKLFSVAHEIK